MCEEMRRFTGPVAAAAALFLGAASASAAPLFTDDFENYSLGLQGNTSTAGSAYHSSTGKWRYVGGYNTTRAVTIAQDSTTFGATADNQYVTVSGNRMFFTKAITTPVVTTASFQFFDNKTSGDFDDGIIMGWVTNSTSADFNTGGEIAGVRLVGGSLISNSGGNTSGTTINSAYSTGALHNVSLVYNSDDSTTSWINVGLDTRQLAPNTAAVYIDGVFKGNFSTVDPNLADAVNPLAFTPTYFGIRSFSTMSADTWIDDFSVEATDTSAPIPEPAALSLLIAGGGLMMLRRGRRVS